MFVFLDVEKQGKQKKKIHITRTTCDMDFDVRDLADERKH